MDFHKKKQVLELLNKADGILDEEGIEDHDIRCQLGSIIEEVGDLEEE